MNKKSVLSYITFLLIVVSVSYFSCVKDVGPLPVTKSVTFCDSLNVKWPTDIQAIIQIQCINPGCHAAGGPQIDLSTYALLKPYADQGRIRARVIDGAINGWMPTTGPLPVSERDKIDCWLKGGSLEN